MKTFFASTIILGFVVGSFTAYGFTAHGISKRASHSSTAASASLDSFKAVDNEIVSELGDSFTLHGNNTQGQPCTITVTPFLGGHKIKVYESQVSSVETQPKTHYFVSYADRNKAAQEHLSLKEAYFENSMGYKDFHAATQTSRKDSRGFTQAITRSLTMGGRRTSLEPTDPQYKQGLIEFVAISKTITSDSLYAETLFSDDFVSCHRLLGTR